MALSCCVLYLAFSLIAGTAHVHHAADDHDERRGLHLDHAHIGHGADPDPDGHDHPASSEPSESCIVRVHVEQRDGDALELRVTAHGLSAPALRVLPATVVTTVTVGAPSFVSLRGAEPWNRWRGPPTKGPVPARAPPA